VPANASASLQVDGTNQGTIEGAQRNDLAFANGTSHTVSVGQYVAGPAGVRFDCPRNTWSFNSTGSHTFNYQTQYELSIISDPEGVLQTTSEWYDPGSIAKTSPVPRTVQGNAVGVKYVFNYWVVDGVVQVGNLTSLTMNEPHTVIAKFTVQYLLTVLSPNNFGDPEGSGYYDAGTVANFSVSTPVGFLVQQVFAGWAGDTTGTSPHGSIAMTRPIVVHAVWITSYVQLFLLTGAIFAVAVVLLAMHGRENRGLPNAT
jgi:hypothetical protein